MAEEEIPRQFIQIASSGTSQVAYLYALDSQGDVWQYVGEQRFQDEEARPAHWKKLSTRRGL